MDSDDGSDACEPWESELGAPVATSTPSFEAYFVQASSRAATSSNVFSSHILPLSADEYATAIAAYKARSQDQTVQTRWTGPWNETTAFRRYARELAEGFNLLFYGFGSKRTILNKFATECLAKKGHVVVVNGFQPNTTLKDILASIERVPGVLSHSSSLPLSAEQRVYDFFAKSSQDGSRVHLYLVVHNIDSPVMRSQKIRNFLSLLALNPHVHLVASIDRLNAPLLWSTSDITARKSPSHNPGDVKNGVRSRGYAWLWHDLTTLSPYDFELTYADRSSISGAATLSTGARSARQGVTAGGATSGGPLSEAAVVHVLAAVTAKAKKLFTFLAAKQLENIEATTAENSNDLQQYGLTYDSLFSAARAEFIATNDTTLRSLLGEFMDHGLILSVNQGGQGGGETLWIPLRKERIMKILQSLNSE
ncbi:origin recognition complex, subunit 2 [Pisolithus albus]|nr:origin recognition complex, subunit 2 [Pisolithus albus]